MRDDRPDLGKEAADRLSPVTFVRRKAGRFAPYRLRADGRSAVNSLVRHRGGGRRIGRFACSASDFVMRHAPGLCVSGFSR